MHEIPTDGVSARDVFAQLLRQLLDRGDLAQATLARRLRQRGIAQVTEPRVSDWVHGRNLPREESVVFAIESILADAGVAVASGDLVARYWAARRDQDSHLAWKQTVLGLVCAAASPGPENLRFQGNCRRSGMFLVIRTRTLWGGNRPSSKPIVG
jgi:hypothetical protein